MKDVVISIRGTQHSFQPGEEAQGPESVELVTDGRYEYGRDASWFTYQESEITGMEGTVTTFRVEDGLVTLTREGSVNSQMLFQKGRKHVFLYDTPFGAMTMGVDTQQLRTETDEHGGQLDIVYSVDVDNVLLGKNTFRIDWKEIGEKGGSRQ